MVWSRNLGEGGGGASTLEVTYPTDSLTQILDLDDMIGPSPGVALGLENNGRVPGTAARCLTVTHHVANSGEARGMVLRISGINHHGMTVSEVISFSGQAINSTRYQFTRHAYCVVGEVFFLHQDGAVTAADTLRIGVVRASGTLAGTFLDTNGAKSTQFKGFGLPRLVAGADGIAGAAGTLFPTQIDGVIYTQASGAYTIAAMAKTGDFFAEPFNNVMIPAETFVASGDGVHKIVVTVRTNVRSTESPLSGVFGAQFDGIGSLVAAEGAGPA